MDKKNKYVLSQNADQDLEDIFDYTYREFGLDQAIEYLTDLEDIFYQICENPLMGKERNELKVGLYSFFRHSHLIFYRILENHIRIVRVLHKSRDLQQHL